MEKEKEIHILYVGENSEGAPFLDSIGRALEEADRRWPLPEQVREELEQGGAFPAPDYGVESVEIRIAPGVYRERLVICRPGVTLVGSGAESTVIVYGLGALEDMGDGTRRGTFRTATVRISAPDVTARGITFQNDAGFGHTVGQALALYVDGDRCFFDQCRFLGSQDTLFTAPLPLKEAQPGGFRGPGEFLPRVLGRHFYRHCFLQGDVDFIFGGGIAWFEGCTLYSKLPGDRDLPGKEGDAGRPGNAAGESVRPEREGSRALCPEEAPPVYGYITAASTPREEPFGYVFSNCSLESDCPEGTVYLGRPWREYAKTVFLHCRMGAHIHPRGWKDWGKPHGHFYYGEYESYGPGASPEQRADFSHQLTKEEAAGYTVERVMKGWNPVSCH